MFRRNGSLSASSSPRLLLAVLLTVLGTPDVVLAAATPASAALTYTTDEGGANDAPGQRDLTRHGADYANAGNGSITVSFSWDEVGWSGANTGDGCFLFSTDGDGNADYAVCVSAEGSPPQQVAGSPVMYRCGDDAADRCSQPAEVVPPTAASVTACTVRRAASDPFAAGAGSPQDTTADCTIDLDDVGRTGTALLVNTCSLPSGQPNSAPADCVLVPRDGLLRIVKAATPDDPGVPFGFTLDDNDGVSDAQVLGPIYGSGELTVPVVSSPTYTLAEAVPLPAGWTQTSASCDRGETPASLDIASDETVTCTFVNAYDVLPTIRVTKTASPDHVPETGGRVSYAVTVANDGGDRVTLDTLVDDRFGDLRAAGTAVTNNTCDDAATVVVDPGDPPFGCTFDAWLTGRSGTPHVNVVSATAHDPEQNRATGSDDARVTFDAAPPPVDLPPTVDVTKTAGMSTVPEPGAVVTFTATVRNTGTEDVTLTGLEDDVYGDLLDADNELVDESTCGAAAIPAGESFTCSFAALVLGDAGQDHRNVITGVVTDDDGATGTDEDDAVVGIDDVPPTVALTKTPDRDSVTAPGGRVRYTVTVANTGVEPVTLTDLVDDRFGDLLDDATNERVRESTCRNGVRIGVTAAYSCSFTARVAGSGGEHVNVVTGTVVDDEGTEAEGRARATVAIERDEVLGVAEERPPTVPAHRPRPPAVLGDTGAPSGLVGTAGLGVLLLLGGGWVMRKGRRTTS